MGDTPVTKVGEVEKNKVFGDEPGFHFSKKTEFSVLHYSKLVSPHGAQTQADPWELSHDLSKQKESFVSYPPDCTNQHGKHGT